MVWILGAVAVTMVPMVCLMAGLVVLGIIVAVVWPIEPIFLLPRPPISK